MLTKRSARVHAFNIVWYPPRADESRSENESCFEEGGGGERWTRTQLPRYGIEWSVTRINAESARCRGGRESVAA